MPNWNLLARRSHLYLGLLLLPWLLMYGVSTVLFNHRGREPAHRSSDDPWTLRWEKDLKLELPVQSDRLREVGRQLMVDHGLQGPFGVQRQGQRLVVNVQNFRAPVRLTYDGEKQKLRAEVRQFAWGEMLGRLHVRVGYGQSGILPTIWAVFIDLFCVTLLLWIGTGLYLWWKLPALRRWGFVTLGASLITIVGLLLTV
jgi:hypothetical protein